MIINFLLLLFLGISYSHCWDGDSFSLVQEIGKISSSPLSASIEAWQRLQSKVVLQDIKNLPPGIRKELWKIWFNLANSMRSMKNNANGDWDEASWMYQQLCCVETTPSKRMKFTKLSASATNTIPVDALPLSGMWRSCMSWAGLSVRMNQSEDAIFAFVLGCAYVAIDEDAITALDICSRAKKHVETLYTSTGNSLKRTHLKKLLKIAETRLANLIHTLNVKGDHMNRRSFTKVLRVSFLVPAWDEADSMTRSMSFLQSAARNTGFNLNMQIVGSNEKPDITIIADDCATFGNRNRVHSSRIYPGAIRIRYEDECPNSLCDLCLKKADVFLMSYQQEYKKYTSFTTTTSTGTVSKKQRRVVIHTPQPADPYLFYKHAANQSRPINLLLTGCTDGIVYNYDNNTNINSEGESGDGGQWVYPLRRRLAKIVRSGVIAGSKIREHPGYGNSGNVNNHFGDTRQKREKQIAEYAAKLQSAKIVFVTRSYRDYALRKYTEAAFAGALLVGDIPTERSSELFSRFVVKIDNNMSDKDIVDLLLWWLSHDKERIERAHLGQQLMSQLTFENKLKAALGGAILFRSRKFGSHTFNDALSAHNRWFRAISKMSSNNITHKIYNDSSIIQSSLPTKPFLQTPKVPSSTTISPRIKTSSTTKSSSSTQPVTNTHWWGLYVGWVGKQNLGDDALLEIFGALLFGGESNKISQNFSPLKQLTIEQCAKIRHGGVKNAPKFVTLGGGSLVRKNYIKFVDSYLLRFPNSIPLMFGSGFDDYSVSLTSIEARAISRNIGIKNNLIGKIEFNTSISDYFQFFKRTWIGGVRGPITQELLKHHFKTISPPAIMYDPGMLASFLLNVKKKKRNQNVVQRKIKKVLLNVGLSPFYPVFGKRSYHQANSIQVFGRLARNMVEDGVHVTFAPAWVHDIDANIQAAMFGGVRRKNSKNTTRINQRGVIETLSKVPTLFDLLTKMEQVDVVIAMRLHIAIFAHSMQIPFIAVAYRLKTFDWSASVDMIDHVVSIDALNHILLYKMAKKVAFNLDIQAKMAAHNEGAITRWNQFKNEIMEMSFLSVKDSKICSGLCDGFAVMGVCKYQDNISEVIFTSM